MTFSRRIFLESVLAASASILIPRMTYAQQSQVRTVAGTGVAGYEFEGEAGLAGISTPVNNPYGVIIGPDNRLYFCEVDSGRIRRLDLASGRLVTIAGNGEKAYTGDGGPALEASFSAPHEIRFDRQNNLYVVERDAHVVRRIDQASNQVSTLAGNGEPGFSGDGGPAAAAQFRQPHSIAFDASGDLLVCDIGNRRLRRISMATGRIGTLAGNGESDTTPDSAPLNGTPLRGPRSIDTDDNGNAYLVLREGNAVFKVDMRNARLERIAGTGEQGYSGDDGSALDARFNGPKGIAFSAADRSLYIVDTENHVLRRMQLDTGTITTVLGTGRREDGADGDPLACSLNRPHGVCIHNRIIYVTDSENHRIRAVSGII